jgi:hypothetical protein
VIGGSWQTEGGGRDGLEGEKKEGGREGSERRMKVEVVPGQ